MKLNLRNPTPWPILHMNEVKDHRLDLCVFYDTCLNEVAIDSWPGFTCTSCRIYDEEWGKTPKIRNEVEAKEFLAKLRATGLEF